MVHERKKERKRKRKRKRIIIIIIIIRRRRRRRRNGAKTINLQTLFGRLNKTNGFNEIPITPIRRNNLKSFM